jgi:hypothetical protein
VIHAAHEDHKTQIHEADPSPIMLHLAQPCPIEMFAFMLSNGSHVASVHPYWTPQMCSLRSSLEVRTTWSSKACLCTSLHLPGVIAFLFCFCGTGV